MPWMSCTIPGDLRPYFGQFADARGAVNQFVADCAHHHIAADAVGVGLLQLAFGEIEMTSGLRAN